MPIDIHGGMERLSNIDAVVEFFGCKGDLIDVGIPGSNDIGIGDFRPPARLPTSYGGRQ
jgi:hypothetical protein